MNWSIYNKKYFLIDKKVTGVILIYVSRRLCDEDKAILRHMPNPAGKRLLVEVGRGDTRNSE